MAKLKPSQLDISTGLSDNDTVTTKGYVDEHSQNAIWTLENNVVKLTIQSNTIEPVLPLAYTVHPTFSLDTQMVDKKYVDDVNEFLAIQETIPITVPGATVFTLDEVPSGVSAFALFLNGQLRNYGVDYIFSGTTLTWLNPGGPPITLKTTDVLTAWYDYTPVTPALEPLVIAASFSGSGIVTGDDTVITPYFNQIIENRGSVFNPETGDFTAPVTGTYHFDWRIHYYGLNVNNNTLSQTLTNDTAPLRIEDFNPETVRNADEIIISAAMTIKMQATKAAVFTTKVGGSGSKNVGVRAQCIFNGWLVTV